MTEADYEGALAYLFASLQRLPSQQLMQSVVGAGSDSMAAGQQLLASLRALRNEFAHLDRNRASLVLQQLNQTARTEDGRPIEAVYLDLSEAEARAAGTPRLDLSEAGDDLQDALALLDALIADLVVDGARGGID